MWHSCRFLFQRIQTVSAVDPDEPLGGHRFFFGLAQEAVGKANFSVRDNKGNTLSADTCGHQSNLIFKVPIRHLPPLQLNHIQCCTAHDVIYTFSSHCAESTFTDQMKFWLHWSIQVIDCCTVTGYPVVFRQHGVDPDPQEQLQQSAEERLPRARGHFRRRLSHAKQHQHADHQSVHLRPRGQHEAVQRRGADGAGGAQHRSPGGHFALCHHPAQWVQTAGGHHTCSSILFFSFNFNWWGGQTEDLIWALSWSPAWEQTFIANRLSQVLKRQFCISLLNVIHGFLWADNSAGDHSWHVDLIWTAKWRRCLSWGKDTVLYYNLQLCALASQRQSLLSRHHFLVRLY